jgi:hypothetical protein
LSVDESLMQLADSTRCPNRRQLFRAEKIIAFFKRPVKISRTNPDKGDIHLAEETESCLNMDVSERDLQQFRIWHHSRRPKKHSFGVERLRYLQGGERSLMLQQG